jgi:uncharacterized protein YunC (DUF1805 family)
MKALLSIFIFIAISLSATSQNYFWNHYGGENTDRAFHVEQTSDLGFILTGTTDGVGDDPSNSLYLVKTDLEGNEEWSQSISSLGVESGICVRQTSDSGFIVSGVSKASSLNGDSLRLTKFTSEGDEEWTKGFELLIPEIGANLIITNDEGYLICGHVNIDDEPQIKVIKTDFQGNVEWSQVYESQMDRTAVGIVATNDGNYAFCAKSVGTFYSSYEFILTKIAEDGEMIWSRLYEGDEGSIACHSLDVTSDNEYILFGHVNYNQKTIDRKCFLLKTDEEGNEEWRNTYYSHNSAIGVDVKAIANGGFIMTGLATDYEETAQLMYCIKTDPLGNTEWEQIFVEWHSSKGYSCTVTQERGFAFAGLAKITDYWEQAYLVKTNSSGTLGIDSSQSARSKTSVYPNPFSNSATIFLSLSADKRFDLRVLDSRGKVVRNLENVSYRQTFDRGNLNSGIYYYQVLEDGKYYDSGKFIIQ